MTNHGDATSRTAVVYWSDTGNTEAMAEAVVEGVRAAGGEAEAIFADSFGPSNMSGYDSFAFGCPAMGDEVLEEEVFEPMFSSIEGSLRGKRIVLFGSYDWGDGQWMREWEERATGDGAIVAGTAIARLGDIDRDALMRLSADLVR